MATAINIVKIEPTDDGQDAAKILNFETVASYNWLDEPRPTILVPGVPPIWDPPQTSPTLKPDTGGRYIDQDADRTPGSPLQALIHAVQACQPGFDFTNVSIITDRKTMRCLLDFVRAEAGAFKFGVTVVGNTALFTRMEERTWDPPPKRYHGYRDAFEEQYTKIPASAAQTTSHHRVVKYDFADQTILLRYAVDAYLGDLAKLPKQADGIEDTGLEPLVRQHKKRNIKGSYHSKFLSSNTPVTVIDGGCHIPHAATLELSTRGEGQYSQAPDSIEQKLPNFWISQTLNYLLCLHNESRDRSNRSTNFNHIRRISIGNLLIAWEQSNAERLRALARVLGQVVKAAQELGGSCIVSSDGSQGSSLKVSRDEAEEIPALPLDMQSLFLPIKDETTDVPIKQEEVTMTATTASPDGTRKRKFGTEDAPEVTDLPPARRTALDSSFRTFGEVNATAPTGAKAHEGTRKRKLDAEDASELTDSHISRRTALNSSFRTPGSQAITPIKDEEPSVKVKDEAEDSEMEM